MAGTRSNKLTTISNPWLGLVSVTNNSESLHCTYLTNTKRVFTTDRKNTALKNCMPVDPDVLELCTKPG